VRERGYEIVFELANLHDGGALQFEFVERGSKRSTQPRAIRRGENRPGERFVVADNDERHGCERARKLCEALRSAVHPTPIGDDHVSRDRSGKHVVERARRLHVQHVTLG
jgi:hypothetical protein